MSQPPSGSPSPPAAPVPAVSAAPVEPTSYAAPASQAQAGTGPAPPRFCNTCGAPLHPDWVDACPHCAARHARALQAPAASIAKNTPINSAIALYFAFLGASVVMMIAIFAGANAVTTDFVISALCSVLVVAWCVVARRDVAPALARSGNPLWYPAAIGGAVATFTIASIALFLLSHLLHVPQLRMTDEFVHQGYRLPTLILCIAVQPGVIEELAFRGVILTGLQHVLSPWESIFVSALMFMIIHLSVPSFPHLFVIGMALGWLRVQTGSLYPGMLLHFTHNLLCVVFELWRPFDGITFPW